MKWESGNVVVLYACARVCVCVRALVFACGISLGVSFQRSEQKGESEKGKKDSSSYLSLQTSCPACPHTLKHTCTQSHKLSTHTHTLFPFPSVITFNMPFLCSSAVPSKWTITSSYNRKLMQIESGCFVCLLCSNSKKSLPLYLLWLIRNKLQAAHIIAWDSVGMMLFLCDEGCAERNLSFTPPHHPSQTPTRHFNQSACTSCSLSHLSLCYGK